MLPRDTLLDIVHRDLIGPQHGDNEVIDARPGDQYLTGILYPEAEQPEAEDDEGRDTAGADEGDADEAVSMSFMRRPTLMGISFAVEGLTPQIRLQASAARYLKEEQATGATEDRGQEQVRSTGKAKRPAERWRREPIQLTDVVVVTARPVHRRDTSGLTWYVRGLPGPLRPDGSRRWQVTVVLMNEIKPPSGRDAAEEATFFQTSFRVFAGEGTTLVPRQLRQSTADPDNQTNAVIYRDVEEWASGHVCAASWGEVEKLRYVEACWMPRQVVPGTDPRGHHSFAAASQERTGSDDGAFDADQLGSLADPDRLAEVLETIPATYTLWLDQESTRIEALAEAAELAPALATRARAHVAIARDVVRRQRESVALIREDADVRIAFQLAMRAMSQQRRWANREESPAKQRMIWRPFQLGFLLLSLASVARPRGADGTPTADRRTMDLLWFPTGGGKTEAYLALTAFTLIYRRLSAPKPDDGAGVAVLMRYTLRLLTVQQFERAARLVIACDHLRRSDPTGRLGKRPFGLGLWVGNAATPNSIDDAMDNDDAKERAKQLVRCPCCGQESLDWRFQRTGAQVACTNKDCELHPAGALPIWTIDDDIYRERPSLVIGTVDKFAQIVRKRETASLFGASRLPPPELIIQDELHLISGPLGTVTGVYEAAIDLLCTRDGVPPKIVGSTATIRRAEDQVRHLFDRDVLQFPPPVLDATSFCFAVVDTDAPGRLYIGISSAGRSPKFTLQAVCASLLQAAAEPALPEDARDPYWTLVAYFNSLRELGGALVMMHDDVADSMRTFSDLHEKGRAARNAGDEPLELTSRVPQERIPRYLADLERRYPDQPVSTVLATNMISVGVDIPRLGLMVVNGQPKSMSEYIQATSRVGRGNVAGVVVTVYNAGRPRDRSHFEAFRTWHQTLYREVEASSVTPYAPRARDRALHAAVVAVARHLVPALAASPVLTPEARVELEAHLEPLLARIGRADAAEVDGARDDIRRFLDEWQARDGLTHHWWDSKPERSLVVSLETVATTRALRGAWTHEARGVPNSMREVEAETQLRMIEVLRSTGGGAP